MKGKFISSIWAFDLDSNQAYSTHNLFRWYGKLPPELVSNLLDLYAKKSDLIMANFCGSGTVALESKLKGMNCISNDVNPLSLLISKVKTDYFDTSNLFVLTNEIISNARSTYLSCKTDHLYQPDKWYPQDNAKKLVAIKNALGTIDDVKMKDFYTACLMSIVRNSSRIDSRCVNHIVVDFDKQIKDPFILFLQEVKASLEAIETLKFCENVNLIYNKESASNLLSVKDNSIDFCISHHPYFNAVNYFNIYRLSTDLLGSDYEETRQSDFSSKNLNVFLDFMNKSFAELHRVLKDEGKAAVIIGDTRLNGNIVTLGVEFVNLLRNNNMIIEDIFIWELNKKAGMSVTRRGNHIDHNYIIIVKKEVSHG